MQNFGEFSLVRTKLAPPKVGGSPLLRNALLSQLAERRDCKLTVVQGPAGAGKTMLLAQWRNQLQESGVDTAWYNAGVDDDDAQIAAYIAEGLRTSGVSINTESVHLFARSRAKAWKPLLASLVNDILHHQNDIYLFIDDFQNISSFTLLQLIDRWLEAAPSQFHLILGTRMRPPLNIASLIAQDQVTELNYNELRFSVDETNQFLKAQGIIEIGMSQVANLHGITDGWAAGLQLLAFSLRKQSKPEDFLSQQPKLSLSQEDSLNSYLEKAVSEHLSEDEFSFLTRISLCRRFNRSLCELLTGDPRAAEFLAKFEAENLFLFPIDTTDREPWYRFHRLFANFLQRRLDTLGSSETRKLHQLAAHWFAGQNLHVEALRHAKLAEDGEFMIELIDRAARTLINTANFIDLLHWCDAVPGTVLNNRLNIDLCLGWAQLSCSRVDEFRNTIAALEQELDEANLEARNEVQLLKAFRDFRQDNTSEQLEILEPMLRKELPKNTFQRLLLHVLTGLGLVYANRFDEAREIVRAQHKHKTHQETEKPQPFLDVIQGMSHLIQGHVRLALDQLTPVFKAVKRTPTMGTEAISFIIGYLVEAHYQSDDLDSVRELLDQYIDVVNAFGSADSLLLCYRARARIEHLDGDTAGASRTLRRLEELALQQDLDRLLAWSLYEQLLLAIEQDHKAAIDEILFRLARLQEKHGDLHDCAKGEIPVAITMARAEVAFAYDDLAQAQQQLEEARVVCQLRGRGLLETRIELLLAILTHRHGQHAEAIGYCETLLIRAQELGMQRILLDLEAKSVPLIQSVLKSDPDTPHKDLLKRALKAADVRLPEPAQPTGSATDLLTARENDVLIQLSKGLSTKGIARELDLSPGTVKWHLKNIYGKLSAFSRDDALNKARSYHLIN